MDNNQVQFEAVFRTHGAAIFRFAYSLCQSRELAEDLTQEAFLRAWRAFHQLRNQTQAKSWLMTTVRREYARGFERYRPPISFINPDEVAEDGMGWAGRFALWDLCQAIEELPEVLRAPLLLRSVFGYTPSEIACQLDIPKTTVYTRLYRARRWLRAATHP